LGIAGAGEVAWRHAAAAAQLDELRLAAVFDPVAERAGRLAGEYGARAVAAFDELLEAADLIVLAVPHGLHESLAVRALGAGRRVLVEKPLATTVEECDRIIGGRLSGGGPAFGWHGSPASERGAFVGDLVVGQQGRFFEQVRAARDELARLGEPLLYVERRSTDYRRPGRPAWFADPVLAGGGIVMLVGVHSIDRACWLLDSAPAGVAGATATPAGWTVETAAAATLHLANGLRAQLTLVDSPEFFHETTIVCSRGTLVIDPSGLSIDGRRVLTVDADREYTASFRRQYRAILDGSPMATLAEGRLAVAAVRAWYRSAASGGALVSV